MKEVKRILAIALSALMILSPSTAFAATTAQKDITITEPNAREANLNIRSSRQLYTPKSYDEPTSRSTIIISNASDPVHYNLFKGVSSWFGGPATIKYRKGKTVTIKASITGGGGVSAKLLQAQIDATIGASATFTTEEEGDFIVPSGYKGRVVIRYTQDRYTYTVTKNGRSYNGAAYTAAYNQYYRLQLISV